MIITIIIAIPMVYKADVETPEVVVVVVDTAGAAAAVTSTLVCAVEGQYEPVPAKVAMIVYMPVVLGTNLYSYVPAPLVVVVPMVMVLLLGSTAVSVTGTPCGVGGEFSSVAFCISR